MKWKARSKVAQRVVVALWAVTWSCAGVGNTNHAPFAPIYLPQPVSGAVTYGNQAKVCNVTNPPYSAVGDNVTDDTVAIQRAIDDCGDRPSGGTVLLPANRSFVSGSLWLRSNLTFRVEEGAMLIGTTRWAAYPMVYTRSGCTMMWAHAALLNAGKCIKMKTPLVGWDDCKQWSTVTNLEISGGGELNGNGDQWQQCQPTCPDGTSTSQRPTLLGLLWVDGLTVSGMRLRHPAFWTIHPTFSNNVRIVGNNVVTTQPGTDGCDPDSAWNVYIANNSISTRDDCIALKAGKDWSGRMVNISTENVLIEHNELTHGHGVALGSETSGWIRNVVVRDMDLQAVEAVVRIKSMRGRGGGVENVLYERITGTVDQAIQINLDYKNAKPTNTSATPIVRNITLRDIAVTTNSTATLCTGLSDSEIRALIAVNVTIVGQLGQSCSHCQVQQRGTNPILCPGQGKASNDVFFLELDTTTGQEFPPGRPFSPQEFWTAAPALTDGNALGTRASGPTRPTHDFVASGEAEMLSWNPPKGSQLVQPLADTQTLVRFLGGLPAKDFPQGVDPSTGDVVYRAPDGALVMRWNLVWNRLDPFVNNSIQSIIVLDNVPYAFVDQKPLTANFGKGYGVNLGPSNVTEYGNFIRVLLQGIVHRYGIDVAGSLMFRVGTEPNTQPGHWNDTNSKYIDMYVAVAKAVAAEIPTARIGPANFAADGPTRQPNWDAVIMPIAQGIAASEARVDFLAMSCYGRALMCPKRVAKRMRQGAASRPAPPTRWVDHTCEYAPTFATECAARLRSVQALTSRWASLPLQVMEYGDQENSLGIVDPEPGAFGAAWTLASSISLARGGLERAYHWGYGDRNFANDHAQCAAPLSPCGLYGGNIWVPAVAGHLFGSNGTATILTNLSGPLEMDPSQARPTVSGIGGWGPSGELRLLVGSFSVANDYPSVEVQIKFDRPSEWSRASSQLQYRVLTFSQNTSVYDAIYSQAKANGTLQNETDPNVYTLGTMLNRVGHDQVVANGAAWLAMQRRAFSPPPWAKLDERSSLTLSCSDRCELTFLAEAPTARAIWIAPQDAP